MIDCANYLKEYEMSDILGAGHSIFAYTCKYDTMAGFNHKENTTWRTVVTKHSVPRRMYNYMSLSSSTRQHRRCDHDLVVETQVHGSSKFTELPYDFRKMGSEVQLRCRDGTRVSCYLDCRDDPYLSTRQYILLTPITRSFAYRTIKPEHEFMRMGADGVYPGKENGYYARSLKDGVFTITRVDNYCPSTFSCPYTTLQAHIDLLVSYQGYGLKHTINDLNVLCERGLETKLRSTSTAPLNHLATTPLGRRFLMKVLEPTQTSGMLRADMPECLDMLDPLVAERWLAIPERNLLSPKHRDRRKLYRYDQRSRMDIHYTMSNFQLHREPHNNEASDGGCQPQQRLYVTYDENTLPPTAADLERLVYTLIIDALYEEEINCLDEMPT
jgi:hypothetical protein